MSESAEPQPCPPPPEGRLVWIDLEMTGLDPDRDRILEIATIVTDDELNLIAEGPDLVVHQPDALLDGMDPWNTEHHGDSGLTQASRESGISESEAEERTLAFLRRHVAEGASPLCGNTVHQDKRFLVGQMPRIDAYFHYRSVDVSTIKELAKRWYPAAYEAAPAKQGGHRAMEDIRESIAELRYYRGAVMQAAEA